MRKLAFVLSASALCPTVDAQCTSSLVATHRFTPDAGMGLSPFVGGVAYDPITDVVYVLDQVHELISSYDRTSGANLESWPTPSPGGLIVPRPIGGAVDIATGNVWVVDEGEVVYEFDPSTGTDTGVAWSTRPGITDAAAIAFDPGTRTVFVSSDSVHVVREFDLAGNPIAAAFEVATAGSVDADGIVYNRVSGTFFLGEDTGDQIIEIDRTGAPIGVPVSTANTIRDVLDPSGPCITISPEGLAIDTRTGSLFIAGGLDQPEVFEVRGMLPSAGSAIATYGVGCPDSSGRSPRIVISDPLTVGRTAILAVQSPTSGAAPGTPVSMLLGFQPGNPVTFDLTGFGFAGCTLLVNPSVVTNGTFNHNGRAALTLTLGNDPALIGFTMFAQGFYAQSVHLVMTNAVQLTVQ